MAICPTGFDFTVEEEAPSQAESQSSEQQRMNQQQQEEQQQQQLRAITTFKWDDYKFSKALSKKTATHHAFRRFEYFDVPIDKEDDVLMSIIGNYLRGTTLTICEHFPEKRPTRFFIDVDLPLMMEDIEKMMPIIQNSIQESFNFDPASVPFKCEKNVEALRSWGVLHAAELDNFCCMVLISYKKPAYHFIWPFVRVGKDTGTKLLENIKTAIKSAYPSCCTGKLEIPKESLRAPFCDKTLEGTDSLAKRPYKFHSVWRNNGKAYTMSYSDYPFPYIEETRQAELSHCRAVMALSSIRWDLAHLPNNTARIHLNEMTAAATVTKEITADEWASTKHYYDPSELRSLIEILDNNNRQEIEGAIVWYVNRCCAMNLEGEIYYKYEDSDGELQIATKTSVQMSLLLAAPRISVNVQKGCYTKPAKKKRNQSGGREGMKGDNDYYIDDDNSNSTNTTVVYIIPWNVWKSSDQKTMISGFTFDPLMRNLPSQKKYINLFKGWRYNYKDLDKSIMEYKKNGYGLQDFLNHIYNVICSKDVTSFVWIIKWMAVQLQYPGYNTMTTPVFGGGEGGGKSAVLNVLCHLMGRHSLRTHSIDDLVGRFSHQLVGVLFVMFDEMDGITRQQNSIIKGLITDPIKRFEQKFKSPFHLSQTINIGITSNEPDGKLVMVSHNSRRYAMFFCAPHPHNTHEVWDKHYAWLTSDSDSGYKAILFFLMSINLNTYNTRDVPVTKMLLDQKANNMDIVHQYLWELITSCQLVAQTKNAEGKLFDNIIPWPGIGESEFVIDAKTLFYDGFLTWAQRLNTGRGWTINKFKVLISRVMPSVQFKRTRSESNVFVDSQGITNVLGKILKEEFVFPPVEQCRKEFCTYYKGMEAILDQENKKKDDGEWEPVDIPDLNEQGLLTDRRPLLPIPKKDYL